MDHVAQQVHRDDRQVPDADVCAEERLVPRMQAHQLSRPPGPAAARWVHRLAFAQQPLRDQTGHQVADGRAHQVQLAREVGAGGVALAVEAVEQADLVDVPNGTGHGHGAGTGAVKGGGVRSDPV